MYLFSARLNTSLTGPPPPAAAGRRQSLDFGESSIDGDAVQSQLLARVVIVDPLDTVGPVIHEARSQMQQ